MLKKSAQQGRSSAANPRFTFHASLERGENADGGLFQHPTRAKSSNDSKVRCDSCAPITKRSSHRGTFAGPVVRGHSSATQRSWVPLAERLSPPHTDPQRFKFTPFLGTIHPCDPVRGSAIGPALSQAVDF